MRPSALGLIAVLTAASLSGATSAEAQSAGTYPASRATPDLVAWLRRDTPLDPAKVVDVSPSSITEVASSEPTTQPVGFVAILHAEALDATIEKAEGILSWAIPVELDCPAHKVRLGAMTGFPGRDIRYGPKTIRGPDDDWVTPAPKAPLDNVLRALCERGFQRPLAADARIAAQAAPAPVRTPAAASPPAPPPAQARATPVPPPPPRPALQAVAPPAKSGSTVATAVQVGATPDTSEAKAILARVKGRFPGDLRGLKTDIVTVVLDGKTVYRVVISGFSASAEATGLCATLKAGGQACFVRG